MFLAQRPEFCLVTSPRWQALLSLRLPRRHVTPPIDRATWNRMPPEAQQAQEEQRMAQMLQGE